MMSSLLVLFLFEVAGLWSSANPPSGFQTLKILYTSDLHSRLTASSDFGAIGLPRRKLGGLARLAGLIKQERTGATLLLDCGDFGFGSPEGDSSQGRVAVQFMNRLEYDAAVLGARDFNGGLANVELLARAAAFPLLADPMLDVVLNRRSPLFRPCLVKEVQGIRVGIIGLTDPDITRLNPKENFSGLVIDEPLVQLRRFLPAVQAESAEVIVVIGHITPEQGCLIAESLPEIDAVLGSAGPSAVESRLSSTSHVPIVRTGAYGQRLGVLDILFNKKERRVEIVESRVMNVDEHVEPDSGILSLVADWTDAGMDTVVAECAVEFPSDSTGRLKLALLVADAVRKTTGADIAILPISSIESGLDLGPVTKRELFNVVPYRERVRMAVLADSQVSQLLTPVSPDGDEPAPALSGADLFVTGDTLRWPITAQVVRPRIRELKAGLYRLVTTEAWLEHTANGKQLTANSRLLADNLTELWLRFAESEKHLSPVPFPRRYLAPAGLVPAQTGGLININTATSELLQTLPGIGPKTAERIIEFRQTHGRFQRIEQLMEVKGIGPKKFERIKNLITVR